MSTHLSKLLSLVLRHQPETIGIELDAAGWTPVDALLHQLAVHGQPTTDAQLRAVVAASDKQRFAFSPDSQRIRANQGHSVPVDLGLEPVAPPDTLFHGTAERNVAAIRREGLSRQARHHVHLSPDEATARAVGQRYGRPVVLRVASGRMHAAGHQFYRSANGVWLTDAVAPEYLSAGEND